MSILVDGLVQAKSHVLSASCDDWTIARLQRITCTHSRTYFIGLYEGCRRFLFSPGTTSTNTLIITRTGASICSYSKPLLRLDLQVGRNKWAALIVDDGRPPFMACCIQMGSTTAAVLLLNQREDRICGIFSPYLPALAAIILTILLRVIFQFEQLHEGLPWTLGSSLLTTLYAMVLGVVN